MSRPTPTVEAPPVLSPPILGEVTWIDPDRPPPSGSPCSSCGAPVEALDKFCLACGAPNRAFHAPAPTQSTSEQRHIQCKNCGAEVAIDPDQRSYVCAFCDSPVVVELDAAAARRQPPEFVIGFAFTPEQARDRFRAWLRDGNWFRPGDLVLKASAEQFKGVYLPFWSFSMLAESEWSSQVGMYWYRTETYTTVDSKGKLVTRTRQVRETEWFPLEGRHHLYHSGYLVSGSKGLSQSDALTLMPYQLPAAKRFEPYFLAGWISEEYTISREEALPLCQEEFARRERASIAAFQPGDTHSSLQVQTQFSYINSDLWLIPVYILHYRYEGKTFRVLINGQTGRIVGGKPFSWTRVGVVAAAVALVLLGIVLGILFLASMG